MGSELSILALYGLWVCVVILVQVLLAVPQVGLGYLASPRDEGKKLEGAAGRSLRCVENSIVAMALFAPAVLILQAKGLSTSTTLLMGQVFLVARVVHTLVYLAGIPWLRTLVWVAGFLATAVLYLLGL